MIWVGWRQQRTELVIAAGVIVLLAAALIPSGLAMASAYHHDGLAACLGAHPSRACDGAVQSFVLRFEQIGNLLGWLTLLPGLVGVLLAAPFVLQLESGGYRLDWTQGITRGRWIATKLALAVGTATVVSLCFVALITWWRTPLVHLNGRMEPSVFDSEGIVVPAYMLFALGLALAIGVVWRKTVASLVVGFVGYFVARIFVDTWLRQRLTPPAALTWLDRRGDAPALRRAWVITEHPSDKSGHDVPRHCIEGIGNTKACIVHQGGGYLHALYEPASRFWAMQGVEFALFAGAAAVLIAASAWWTHTRIA